MNAITGNYFLIKKPSISPLRLLPLRRHSRPCSASSSLPSAFFSMRET